MQCPDCQGCRHDGPCEPPEILHAEYLEAFQTMMDYQDRHPLGTRSARQMGELVRLESLCEMAKYKFERAQAVRWKL